MREIFASVDSTEVQIRRAMLEEEGISTFVRNENLSQLANTFAAPFQPALCILNEEDYERAMSLLRDVKAPAEGPDWICPQCNELVPSGFASCWNCEAAKPEA